MNNMMERVCNKLQKPLAKMANKLNSFLFIQAMAETFQLLLPIMFVGAFACIIYSLDLDWWQNILSYVPIVTTVCSKIHMLSLFIFALYVLVVLPGRYADKLELKASKTVVPITVITFLMLTPVEMWTNIPVTWIGQQGIFSVMLLSWIVPRAMKLMEDKNFRIKMPESVPTFVADGFTALLPALVIVPIAGIIGALMENTSFGSIHNVIYTVIQQPFTTVGISPIGSIVKNTTACLMFFFGIHPGAVTGLFEPLLTAGALENLEAYSAGLSLPNICVGGFVNLTDGNGWLCASLAVLLFAKNKRYKQMGKMTVIPSVFGISEPLVFGLPIMMNMYLFIPWMITCTVNILMSYGLIALGVLGRYTGLTVNFSMPFIVNQLLTSTTPIRAAIWQVVQLGIDLLIWYPFVRIMDREETKKEEAQLAADPNE